MAAADPADAAVGAEWRLAPGDAVDHFRVLRPLGRGGMGDVYVARDEQLGRRVALKLIRAPSSKIDRAAARARLEARTTARLSHPNIITIYAIGEHEGAPYLALELVEGETLRARLDAGPFAIAEAIRAAVAIASALREAHRHGVQHRDLKPSNVLLGRDGRPRVVDFGLAGLSSQEGTTDAGRGGTPAYMAPEQWNAGDLTPAVDVFAFGVMLHELLAGARPPDGDVPPLTLERPDIPSALDEIVHDCLTLEPTARPSASVVHERLAALADRANAAPARDESPFKGLLPFTEQDAGRFYGRDSEIASLVERLRSVAFVAIVGASGAGKSSFVQAGLVPRLRERGPLRVVHLRPGRHPLATLAERVRSADVASRRSSTVSLSDSEAVEPEPEDDHELDDLETEIAERPALLGYHLQRIHERTKSRVVLFVDQLEEIVTLTESDEERRAFMDAVCLAAEDPVLRVRTIVTFREEFLTRIVAASSVGGALQQILVLENPGREALKHLLQTPVEAAGYEWEDPTILDEMTDDVADSRSCLPLLQFAAARLWDERDRDRRLLLRSAYERMGGVAGALAKHADAIMDGMPQAQVRAARTIFLRLVTPERTRRTLSRAQLTSGLDAGADDVLDRLSQARLLVAQRGDDDDDAAFEIVHESLIDSWDRLSTWLSKTSEERARIQEIEQAATAWKRRGRLPSALWRGDALRDAVRALEGSTTDVPELLRAFVQASSRRERRARWQVRLATLAVIAALSIAAVGFAIGQRDANREREVAVQRRAQAQLEAARAAYTRGRTLEARAILRASLETSDSVAARWLWRRLVEDPLVWERRYSPYMLDVAFSPSGDRLALGTSTGAVLIVDPQTARAITTLRTTGGPILALHWSDDGRTLLAVDPRRSTSVWSEDGVERRIGDRGELEAGALIGDGETMLAGVGADVQLRSTRDGKVLRTVGRHDDGVRALAATGDLAVSAGNDGSVRLWRGPGHEADGRFDVPDTRFRAVALSEDRALIAAGSEDGRIFVWRVEDRSLLWTGAGHDSFVRRVRFARGGKRLVSTADGGVVVWDVATKKSVRTFDCPDRAIGASISPTGEVAFGCRKGLVRVMRLDVEPNGDVRTAHHSETISPCISPNGKLVASGSSDNRVLLWDVETGRRRPIALRHEHAVWSTIFTADGDTIITGQEDGEIRLWDVSSGRVRRTMPGHTGGIYDLAIGANEKILASASVDGTMRAWNLEDGTLRWSKAVGCNHQTVDVDAEGRVLHGCVGRDAGLYVWSIDGERVDEFDRGTPTTWTAWNGEAVLLQNPTGRLLSWRPTTGETTELQGEAKDYVIGWDRRSQRIAKADIERFSFVDLDGGNKTAKKFGHHAFTNYMGFAPDGRSAVSSGGDGAVRLWDTATAEPKWWTRAFASAPPRLYTHRGWLALDRVPVTTTDAPAWAPAADGMTFAVTDDRGRRICVHRGEALAAYDERGEPIGTWALPKVDALVATNDACVVMSDGRATRFASGKPEVIAEDAVAIRAAGDELLVATKEATMVVRGASVRRFGKGGGASAIVRVGRWIALGFDRGQVRLLDPTTEQLREVALDRSPQSVIEMLVAGPGESLIAGYANGAVVGWDLETGTRLVTGALNGHARYGAVEGDRLVFATELGDFGTWDLSAVGQERCAVLRDVWRRVPVVWANGAPVRAAPPAKHDCWNASFARD